ncbi:hypothetical protein FQA47_000700 [Oryzias melastigma]|uniref:Uncharacterized protein n=1 Tax=Oryzias melastigma TaxID=30732 RepID=A0A834C2M7_ORYME|nr:hypothetical protein FQA47_000700 [Oryzias melastigma]
MEIPVPCLSSTAPDQGFFFPLCLAVLSAQAAPALVWLLLPLSAWGGWEDGEDEEDEEDEEEGGREEKKV